VLAGPGSRAEAAEAVADVRRPVPRELWRERREAGLLAPAAPVP
jgi:alkylation response protein AidB-like acyl-CoA dehydrogenase